MRYLWFMPLTNPFQRSPKSLSRLPRIVRLVILNWMIGFGLAAVFTGMILAFDVAGIRHLVTSVDGGWLAAFVFFMLNGIVFAGAQTGIVVMMLDASDKGDRKGAPALATGAGLVSVRAAPKPGFR